MLSVTATPFQVIEELLSASFFNARDRQLSMGHPMEKMLRCANVFTRCHPLIAVLEQCLGEPFKQMATRVSAQFLDT
jgi:hypothetical protein